MKTKSIHFAALQVGEVFSFILQVVAIFRSSDSLNARLHERVEGLSKTIVEMEGVISRASFAVEGKKRKATDSKRDSEYLCFKSFIEAFIHSTNPAINEAANLIFATLKEAGSVQRLKLDKETSTIYGLNSLFSTNERYIAALKTLNGRSQWDVVMAAQLEFEEESKMLGAVKVKEAEPLSAYKLSVVARRQCADILEMLNALNLVDPRPEYDELVARVNLEIDTVMQQVRTRKTLAAKAKKKAEGDAEEKES